MNSQLYKISINSKKDSIKVDNQIFYYKSFTNLSLIFYFI